MADLPCSVKDREYNKFGLNSNDEVCVRTCTEITGGSVDTTPQGIAGPFLITTMQVGDTATALPASPLTDRKAFAIANLSEVNTLYVGPTNSVVASRALGTSAGWEIGPGETANFDYDDAVSVFGIVESGKTIIIKIFESA